MPEHSIQEWLAFAIGGIAVIGTGLLPAVPTAADAQYVAFGVLLLFAAAVGLAITSPTVIRELRKVDRLLGDKSPDT